MNVLVALCPVGSEKIVGNEIKLLGYTLDTSAKNVAGRVSFLGDDKSLFRANLCLRTADRVYLQVCRFPAPDFASLFDGVRAFSWQDFFKKDVKIVVDKVRSHKSTLSSVRSIQSVVQKAIYEKLGEAWGMRTLPESGTQADVRVYIDSNEAQILLDLSGEPLHKRGYRTDGGAAPLRETVASAMLQSVLWRRKMPLHDPFCGSGTILTEAALFAYNVAPGFGRHFALEHLAIFNETDALETRHEEAAKIRFDVECRITGTDIDSVAVERAKKNAEHALVSAGRALQEIGISSHLVRPDFDVADFKDIAAPYENGVLLMNPPYGERLGSEDEVSSLYRDMKSLFLSFPNWKIGVLTPFERFEECLTLHSTSKKVLRAGNLDTSFYIFDGKNIGKKHPCQKKSKKIAEDEY